MAELPAARNAVPEELATAIDRTLQTESRHNEIAIAWVRAVAFVGLAAMETYYWVADSGLEWFHRVPTYAYLALSVGLLFALRSGWHPSWLRIGLPLLDATVIVGRIQATFTHIDLAVLEQIMELATAALGASLLVVTGGFRMSRSSLWVSTLAGLFIYLWFAAQTRLDAAQMVVHVVLLVGVAAATAMLTQQVRRAVRSEVARVTLARFLPHRVVDGIHQDPIGLVTQPRAVRATVLVSDIRGFTTWAESRSPIEVLAALNVIQGRLAAVVVDHHGVVDKFMGDGMLAVFGVPESREDHADLAVRAALAMQQAVSELATGDVAFRVGIGVHTGELVVGCLGSGLRMEFTVLGDTVNTASRLEALTKEVDLPLLVSGATVAERGPEGLGRVADVQLRGRIETVDVWTMEEVVAPRAWIQLTRAKRSTISMTAATRGTWRTARCTTRNRD
ncbi:MAG: adenylate/guanylate cyclase domain-containing protein [Myxococcota bacterium]